MGFMATIKQWFGIGGVKVEVDCPPHITKESRVVNGAIKLSAKSPQHVLALDVMLVEEYTTGRNEDEETREFELGKVTISGGFEMAAGETKVVGFQLPFDLLKSNADELKERGDALGALGSIAKLASAEKSEYIVRAECDVKGTALDPSGKRVVQLL